MSSLRRVALLFVGLIVAAVAVAQTPDLYGAPRDPMQHFFAPGLGDLQSDLADARRAGKEAAFVMFMRDDCPYCERMKKNILALSGVQSYYRQHFAVIAIDVKGAVPITDFAGRQTTEKEFAAAQGVKYTPTILFYGLDGKPLTRIDGEIRSVEDFLRLGDFVASGAYRSTTFAEYRRQGSSARLR